MKNFWGILHYLFFSRAQTSLEFLLVASAFLGLLGLSLSGLSSVFSQGQFGLAAADGQRLADAMQSRSDLLKILGNGSQTQVKVPAFSNAQIQFEGQQFRLVILSPDHQNQKVFVRDLALPTVFNEFDLQGVSVVVLKNQDNELVIEPKTD